MDVMKSVKIDKKFLYPYEEQKAILISHKEDIDGIVSAALLYSNLRKVGFKDDQIEIHLMDYTSVIEFLQTNVTKIQKHTLYLADIGINDQIYQLLLRFSPIESLPAGVCRYYYDHHTITGDSSEIYGEIKKRFNEYKNPFISQSVSKICTAEVIYHSLNYHNSYYYHLCEYAHIGDFSKGGDEKTAEIVEELRMFITYYQNMDARLKELILNMQKPETWENYFNSFVHNASEVTQWVVLQQNETKKNLICSKIGSLKIAMSFSDLKSEDIVGYLKKMVPEHDIYLGFSKRNNYVNIQTHTDIAHRIAAYFGGGGHPKRAGFKIPDEILDFIYNKQHIGIMESNFIKKLDWILSEIKM